MESHNEKTKSIPEKNQCKFVNTIGMRCPEGRMYGYKCCAEHLCTYMMDVDTQCHDTVDCHSRWYCRKHAITCKCQYHDSNVQNVIEWYIFILINLEISIVPSTNVLCWDVIDVFVKRVHVNYVHTTIMN